VVKEEREEKRKKVSLNSIFHCEREEVRCLILSLFWKKEQEIYRYNLLSFQRKGQAFDPTLVVMK
jgi:hypothetical protein